MSSYVPIGSSILVKKLSIEKENDKTTSFLRPEYNMGYKDWSINYANYEYLSMCVLKICTHKTYIYKIKI